MQAVNLEYNMDDFEDEVDEEMLSSRSTYNSRSFRGSSPCKHLAQTFGFGPTTLPEFVLPPVAVRGELTQTPRPACACLRLITSWTSEFC